MNSLKDTIIGYAGIINEASGEQLANICTQLYNKNASDTEIKQRINSLVNMASEYKIVDNKSVLKNFANSPKEWKDKFFNNIKNVPTEFANKFWTTYLNSTNNLMKSNNSKGSELLANKAKENALAAAKNIKSKTENDNEEIRSSQLKQKAYASIFTY